MPALAVNDTPLSRELLRAGRLRDGPARVDYLETSGPKADSAAREIGGVPLLLHNAVWDWSLAHPDGLGQDQVARLTERRLAATGTPWLSVHVGFASATVAYRDGMRPTSPVLGRDAALDAMTRTVRELASRTGVPVLLENLDYQTTGAYEHVCEPAFIAELLEASGAGLLLDLAHASVSASRMGVPVGAYLDRLPLERVRQLHVSGPRDVGGALDDAHEPLRDRDLELLEEVLARTSPWALTLEYGRDEVALLDQLATLRTMTTG